MDTNKISEFVERYQNMHEDELAIIHQKQSSLVEEAKVALATVILERKIDLTKLAQEEHQEKEQRIKKQEIITEKKQKRNAFFNNKSKFAFVIFLIIINWLLCIVTMPTASVASYIGRVLLLPIMVMIFALIDKKTRNLNGILTAWLIGMVLMTLSFIPAFI